jgi:thiol:disulfide interchange protein DsbG
MAGVPICFFNSNSDSEKPSMHHQIFTTTALNLTSTLVLVIALSGLSACSKPDTPSAPTTSAAASAKPDTSKPDNTKPAAAQSAVQTYDTVAAQGKGFSVGAMMAANPVYVLFDPQCPHCGHLWEASLPLHSKLKFVWIPVGIMNGKSASQGAALLQAGNPVEVMSAHEKSILAGTGGTAASATAPPDIEQAVKKNTELFTSLGADSVPYLVAKNARTGQAVTHSGAMDTPALATMLGVEAP